jgi:hypothetical protein
MNILERSFKKSKNFSQIMKEGWFTFYVLNSSLKDYPQLRSQKNLTILKNVSRNVQNKLHSLGFNKMSSPVLLGDLSGDKNTHTARGTAGWASKTHIAIDYKYYLNKNYKELFDILYHEWAHRYLFQKSKDIKQNITDLHSNFIQTKFLEAIEHLDENDGLEEYIDKDIISYDKIIKTFSSYFKSFFDPGMGGQPFFIQKMLEQNMDFSEFPSLVGFGVTIFSNLKDQNKTPIYAYHIHNGWIVGNKNDIIKPIREREKIEKKITESEAYSSIENLNSKIKHYYENKDLPTEHDLTPLVWEKIFDRTFKRMGIQDQKFIDKHKHFSEFVVNKMKNFNIDAYSEREIRDPYELFWVDNEYKPKGISLVNNILRKKSKDYLLQLSKNPKDVLKYISSADGEKMRKIIAKITNMNPNTAGIFFGITDYGMSSKDELWVSFLENIEKMPKKYRNQILKI